MVRKYRLKLGFVESENNTGFEIDQTKIEKFDYDSYKIIDKTIGGDNPKKVIKHKLITGKKRNKWITYIAKTAGKWYPNESICEYLIFRIGKILDFDLAESKIVIAEGQLRFLSKYFLIENAQILRHGLEFLVNSGLFQSREYIHEIDKSGAIRKVLTLQIIEKILSDNFPDDKKIIFNKFIKLIIFDAYVGNNDRHPENWAIITHIENKHPPYFSPIYDTARALFWNESETKLINKFYPPGKHIKNLENYADKSMPKISWDKEPDVNHFRLFELIVHNEYGISKDNILEILSEKKLKQIFEMIDVDFQGIISKERSEVIKSYLAHRRTKLLKLVK